MGLNDALQQLQTTWGNLVSGARSFVSANPVATSVGIGTAALGVGLGVAAAVKSRRKRKRRSTNSVRKRSSSRGRKSRDRIFMSKQKHEQRYKRKRKYKIYGKKGWIHPKKSKSKKGIHYTKHGQPYKILPNGRARFIKK